MALFSHPIQPSYLNRSIYHACLLGIICCIVGVMILAGEHSTRDHIKNALDQDQRNMLAEIIPKDLYNNDITQTTIMVNNPDLRKDVKVFIAQKDDEITAFAYNTQSEGYGGTINMIIGVNISGEILGVRVIQHSETPGLGDKIEITKDSWITSFNGRSLENTQKDHWNVKKDGGDFDQFTGATITPRAVVRGVERSLIFFRQNKHLFIPPIKKQPTDFGHSNSSSSTNLEEHN